MRKGSNFILCLWLSRYLAPFVEKTILSPLNYFGTLVKNQLTVNWGFSSRLYLLNFYWMLLLLLLLSHFSRVQLCNPIDGSPPDSSIPGILQARILEWVAISFFNACSHAKSLQLCPTLCNPMDSSPPGSSVHGILQARILEWVAISLSQFICKVVLFSGVWQSDSVFILQILFCYSLL